MVSKLMSYYWTFPKHSIKYYIIIYCINFIIMDFWDLLDWIKNFVSIGSQCVVVDGQQLKWLVGVSSGVPHSFLLPLFLCFINDLPTRIASKIKLYADDVLLYTTIHSQEDCHRLQKDLDTLEQWAINWKMSFNLQKCEFLRVKNKKHPILACYTQQNKTIKEVTHTKYLHRRNHWSKLIFIRAH